MERRKAVRASGSWLSHSHAERDDNDVAPCGAPSPLALRFSGEVPFPKLMRGGAMGEMRVAV